MLHRWILALRSVRARVVFVLVVAGCVADQVMSVPGPPTAIAVVGGDQQVGVPIHTLARSITVRIVDSADVPIRGALVHWTASDSGAIRPETTFTDGDGVSSATWTLGSAAGVQRAIASAAGGLSVAFTATAYDGDAPDGTIIVLRLDTPDGSGQTVHPDHVFMPSTWRAASEYLTATPYPNGNPSAENPSLYSGSAGTWSPPSGVHNPIVHPTTGYLSDPDAVYVPDANELWVYYRSVDSHNVIQLIRSRDGVHFDAPTAVVTGENHTVVSPTVVRLSNNDWRMWAVNAGIGCGAASTAVEMRRSTDGITWSDPSTVSLSQAPLFPWHIDVQWIPSLHQFWALYNAKSAGSCTTGALYLATSSDGMVWHSYPSPVLARGAIPEFEDVVYRSTFAYDAETDVISFWYSGARYDAPEYVWRSAFQRRARAEVFTTIARSQAAAVTTAGLRRGVPPLRDPP